MIVHKFGGTSIGDAGCFDQVAEIVQEQAAAQRTVVVLSAMSGVTNALVTGARAAADGRDEEYRTVKATLLRRHLDVVEALLPPGPRRLEVGGLIEDRLHELERLYRSIAVLGELTARGCDAVAAFGEPLSAHILAAVLHQRGTRAQVINAAELIVTDDHFGAATPLWAPTRALLQERLRPLAEQRLVPIVWPSRGLSLLSPAILGRPRPA
jgi:aspartate kinase